MSYRDNECIYLFKKEKKRESKLIDLIIYILQQKSRKILERRCTVIDLKKKLSVILISSSNVKNIEWNYGNFPSKLKINLILPL